MSPEPHPPVDRYAQYDALAWFYNRYWGGFAQRVWPVVERLCLALVPAAGRILDVCCGTGQLAALLTARGYRVTGLDGSEAMLRFARENAPGAEFVVADARAFSLPAVYDAAVSTFDSLNHVMTLDDLTTVFRNVRAAARPRGVWLFDLNMEEGYRARWRGTMAHIQPDHVIIDRSSYDPQTRIGRSETTMFRPGTAGWQRSDLTLLQQCYAEDAIRAALEKSGFGEIATYDAARDLGWTGHVGRTFFQARGR